jgi:gamma-glutamylcyclotransferase (GGCT)/AIG2-like uncharacterized protein YtfP
VQKDDYIFVYGTLRQGERADLRKQSHNFDVVFVGNGVINGRLYHLGAFPGLKTLPSKVTVDGFDENLPCICGEVFRIKDVAIVALLDAYEGYDADNPSQGLYNRQQFETSDGRTVWAYVYNGPVITDQLIDSGDWCKSREVPVRRQMLR